ncbi:LysR substrate-binding domain-containing protein [Stenotrophomonas geniculata]|uniref:LysR substrate-binding domain-containing protein n=1 Tax=Stenotrophomonas geniculata TaxID=86188 RepID=UPI00066BB542|nr:LysR substrate-binding domain-containing protein [Stenotrophomonas geniculata]MBH1485942.1 LysR family transcriptional regulator [Stenotrophomonas maltophilia]MBN5136565.1 LysR family transcriptional regulator [Stenotrophomonas maltophilia]MDH7551409.1 LysR substrate-binding domain-containing protein [Stenotrophomonas geniculata]
MVTQRQLPSLAAIRAFEAAARLGSFARAAEELDTSAASVSYHVRRLEAQTGTCLFLRHAQHVELTATGASVAQEATRAFDALRASFMRAADMDAARLRLSVLPTLGTSWLTPRLGTFRARHRQFVLELDLSAAPQDLAAGHFDAAIRNGQGGWPGLQATPLFPSVFTPLCAPALLPTARGLGSSVLEIPLLGRPDWWALWFAAHGHMPPPAPESFVAPFAVEHLDVGAAIAGQGIAIGSPILFQAELDSGRLVQAHPGVASDGRSFWFVAPTARGGSAKVIAFRDWLVEQAAEARHAARHYLARAVMP